MALPASSLSAAQLTVGLLAGYGLVIAVWQLARLVRRQLAPSVSPPSFSVLVLVRDQEHLIEGFLRTLAGQIRTGHGDELLVMDMGSRDDTPAIVERLARSPGVIRLVRVPLGEPPLLRLPGRLAILVDLQGPVDVRPILAGLERLLAGGVARRYRLLAVPPE